MTHQRPSKRHYIVRVGVGVLASDADSAKIHALASQYGNCAVAYATSADDACEQATKGANRGSYYPADAAKVAA